MKFMKVLAVCVMAVLLPLILGGCFSNRPDFPSGISTEEINSDVPLVELLEDLPDEEDESVVYYSVTYEEGIVISSTEKLEVSNSQKLKSGTQIKILFDTNSSIQPLTTTDGDEFYYDVVKGKVITGFKINNIDFNLSELGSRFSVTYDMHISLIYASLNLRSIMLCHNYDETQKSTCTKLESKSFKHSLIEKDESGNVKSTNKDVYYITLDDEKTITSKSINSKIITSENVISLKIDTFLEAIETTIFLIYEDTNGNLYATENYYTKSYGERIEYNIIIDKEYDSLEIELIKGILPK